MVKKLIKFISLDEFKKILKKETLNENKLAYVLAFGSGLRISEIVGPAPNSNQEIRALRKEDVNLQARQIRILGKGGKERITVINPLFPINEKMLGLLPLRIPRSTLQYRFSKLCLRVLGKPLSFHTLRHGFGNHIANDRNLPLPMLQGFMGHTRLDITGIYTTANPQQSVNKVWEGF